MRARLVVAVLLAVVPLAGCGGGDSDTKASATPTASATAPSDVTTAQAEVKTSWTAFFDGASAPAERTTLVQGGADLAAALALAAKDPNARKTTARVDGVVFTSPTEATVTYTLLSGGTPVLKGATGTAVLEGGTWKVSKQTFCGLVSLSAPGKAIPGCG